METDNMPKNMNQESYGKTTSTITIILSIVIFVCFVMINLGIVFSRGVCCGDDSYHAVVAKNLASGLGYTSTILDGRDSFSPIAFDARIGVGPSIILPAALLIKLVGNTYWAPGLTIVILWSTLLIVIGKVVFDHISNRKNFLIAVFVFLFFCVTLFSYHLEHWYSLLGEVPSALFIILGILFYFDKQTKSNLFLTGLMFSFAVQSKQIAILPFVTFFFIVNLYDIIIVKLSFGKFLKSFFLNSLFILLGFITPIFIFEIWRLISLGLEGYLGYWLEFSSFFGEKGVGGITQSWELISSRINLLKSRFGISLPIIFIVLDLIFFELKKDKKLLQIYSVILAIVHVYTIYWLFFSIGWARYYVICLLLIIFGLLFPLFLKQTCIKGNLIYFIILIGISIINVRNLNTFYPFHDISLFTRSTNSYASDKMLDLLSPQVAKRPFITQWWATAADLEYLLPTYSNFTTYRDQEFDFNKPFIVVVDSRFLAHDEVFNELLESCQTIEVNQYIYGICEPRDKH